MISFSWVSVGVVMVAFAVGYFSGYRMEAERFADYRAKVMTEVRVAQEKQVEMIKRHDQTTQFIQKNYADQLDSLDAYYDGLRVDSASGDGVPPVSRAPQSAHGASSCKPLPVVSQECAQTALKLKELQDWFRAVSK